MSIIHDKAEIEVINLRNIKAHEQNMKFTMSNSYCNRTNDISQSSSGLIIEALSEQIESIRNTVVLLEQRLSVVEDELKN